MHDLYIAETCGCISAADTDSMGPSSFTCIQRALEGSYGEVTRDHRNCCQSNSPHVIPFLIFHCLSFIVFWIWWFIARKSAFFAVSPPSLVWSTCKGFSLGI